MSWHGDVYLKSIEVNSYIRHSRFVSCPLCHPTEAVDEVAGIE